MNRQEPQRGSQKENIWARFAAYRKSLACSPRLFPVRSSPNVFTAAACRTAASVGRYHGGTFAQSFASPSTYVATYAR